MTIYKPGTYDIEPPEPYFIMADCGHEVYEGEHLYVWEHGKTLCPDCMRDKVDAMGLDEWAALLGCEWSEVQHAHKKRCE
jgi:hypothetical protein